jgi:hypothetical protein
MIELNDVDGPLQDIKYMAEIAAELIVNLDGINAPPGQFSISTSEGNRLAFACNDLLRRVEELIASLSAPSKR